MHHQNKIPTDYRSLLSLTSLKAAEFFQLLASLDDLWQRYHAHHDLKGERRIKKFAEHDSMSLKGSASKLFFVLLTSNRIPYKPIRRSPLA